MLRDIFQNVLLDFFPPLGICLFPLSLPDYSCQFSVTTVVVLSTCLYTSILSAYLRASMLSGCLHASMILRALLEQEELNNNNKISLPTCRAFSFHSCRYPSSSPRITWFFNCVWYFDMPFVAKSCQFIDGCS